MPKHETYPLMAGRNPEEDLRTIKMVCNVIALITVVVGCLFYAYTALVFWRHDPKHNPLWPAFAYPAAGMGIGYLGGFLRKRIQSILKLDQGDSGR
jgi:hypothetical protein